MRVLLVGESWVIHSTHVKGFDSFTTSEYAEGADYLIAALTSADIDVDHLPAHLVPDKLPATAADYAQWDVVILSDIGANSINLPNSVFKEGTPQTDRLAELAAWVHDGGALVMCGGYLTFSGIEGKAAYHGTPIEAALPVSIAEHDDRVETPAGVEPIVVDATHPVTTGLPPRWPLVLGYNRITADSGDTLVAVGDDPFVVTGEYGRGRTLAWAGDIGPHWAPQEFAESSAYIDFWKGAMTWLTQR